jgi:hypothetical protein
MAQKKRNHFVPKWLLRRFACPESQARDQIWLFRATGKPIRTHINNAGSGNYFYGDPGNGLEDILAKIDDRDSGVLTTVERATDLGPHADAICRMVRLLSIRTRSLREKVTDTATDLFAMLEASVDDPEAEPLIRAHVASVFEADFEKEWEKQPALVRMLMPKDRVLALARVEMQKMDLRSAMAQVFGMVKDKIPWVEAAERGHVNGLLKLLQQAETEPIPEGWRCLSWRVVRMPSMSLILGDCAVFAVRGVPPTPLAGADAGKDPAGLCMPIAPDALLVGTVPDQPFPAEELTINGASAAHSFDSFFASGVTDATLALVARLGAARGVLPPAEMQAIGRSAWRDLDKK